MGDPLLVLDWRENDLTSLDVESKANPNTFEHDFRNMLFNNEFTDVLFRFPDEVSY